MMQSFLIINNTQGIREKEAERLIGKKIASLENNPDFIFLSAKETSIGIDQVREMQNNLVLKPFVEKLKFCLISEAQNLTNEAQNALLKTLEEPPKNCRIVLTAPNESFLLSTIVSRCQIIALPQEQTGSLTKDEENNLLDFLNKTRTSSPGKRFLLLEKEGVAKDKQTAVQWLEKLTAVLRQQLLKLPFESKEYIDILRLINQAKSRLMLNINVRLTMENFLLDLPFQDDVLELKNGS